MHRSFVHLELNVDDTDRARAFYRELFGWDVVDVPMGEQVYTQIKPPAGPGGGIQTKATPEAPSAWVPYVGVKSVATTLRKARAAGARIMVEQTPVPGYGALAIIEDPSGAWLGLWEVADEALDDAESDVVEEEPAEPEDAPSSAEATEKKASAKKASAKKATKKKATKKKATKKKAPAKKATKKKATAKKATAKKATAKKATKMKAPAKKAPARTTKKRTGRKTGRKTGRNVLD
jgi:predicted enzyme related to lactoylglutathione lyase